MPRKFHVCRRAVQPGDTMSPGDTMCPRGTTCTASGHTAQQPRGRMFPLC